MKTYIFILLLPLVLCFSGKALSQINQEEEVIITKPAEDTADINTFYEELAKDGDWIKTDNDQIDNEDGQEITENVTVDEDVITEYIWRPTVSITFVDWNPYSYGHWEWCRFGWIWVSDYSWGWGPYHYGRWWYSHRWGWVWSPGHRWAHNWVSWCHTRHHVGWHPISPRTPWKRHNGVIITNPKTVKQKSITNKWTFVEKKDFTKKITSNNTVDIKKNKEILEGAKITSVGGEVYNVGPKKKEIESVTGEKITKTKVSFADVNGKPIKENNITKPKLTKENSTKTNNQNRDYKTKNKQSTDYNGIKTKRETKKTNSDNGYKAPKNDNGYKAPKNDNGYKTPKNDNGYKAPKNDNGYRESAPNNGNTSKSPSHNSGNTYKSPEHNSGNTSKSPSHNSGNNNNGNTSKSPSHNSGNSNNGSKNNNSNTGNKKGN